MSPEAGESIIKGLLKKHAAALRGGGLARPELPGGPLELPAGSDRYPLLQELAAQKQGIHDEFSRIQLDLQELRANLEADLAVISGKDEKSKAVPPPVISAQAEKPAAPPAASRPVPASAEMPPAAEEAAGRPAWAPRVIAAAFLCAAALLVYAALRGGAVKTSFPLPPTAAAGLCLDGPGSRVFFTDPRRQLLIAVSVAGKRVETMQSFQAQGLKSLAFDGASFWSSDGTSVYRHGSASGFPAESAYKAGPGVYFLGWDGRNLWAATAGGRLVRYAAGEKPSPEAVYQLPEGIGAWLAVSGGRIWELDPASGRLNSYTLSVKPELLARADVRQYLPRGELAGFAVNGGYAWVITADPAELARLDLKRLKLFK